MRKKINTVTDKLTYGFPSKKCEEFPRMVVAGVSYACNAECLHCIYSKFPETKTKFKKNKTFMEMSILKKVADECASYPQTLLRFVGFGEPMLHPAFIDMITYAKNRGCNVGVITNGSLLNKSMIEALLDANVDAVDISVDAFSKETYENIRVGLNFNKLVTNVKRLVDLRNKKEKKTFIFCSIVEQEAVMHELKSAIEFWGKIVDKVVSRKFLTFGLFKNSMDRKPYYDYKQRVPCFLLYDRINIDVNGEIRLCGYDSFGKTCFGNIKDTSIYEVWHGQELNYIRRCHQKGRFDKISLCKDCEDWPFHSWNKNYMTNAYSMRRHLRK